MLGASACRSGDLQPVTTRAIHLLNVLVSSVHGTEAIVEHVCREYNFGAEAVPNIAIDEHDARIHLFAQGHLR